MIEAPSVMSVWSAGVGAKRMEDPDRPMLEEDAEDVGIGSRDDSGEVRYDSESPRQPKGTGEVDLHSSSGGSGRVLAVCVVTPQSPLTHKEISRPGTIISEYCRMLAASLRVS